MPTGRTKRISSTLYDLLQVSQKASTKEIKAAYYQKCLQFHPDLHEGEEAKETFLLLSQAFQTLSDSEKRAEYDATLHPKPLPNSMIFPRTVHGFHPAPISICTYPFRDSRNSSETQAKERLSLCRANKKALRIEFSAFVGTLFACLMLFVLKERQ